MLKINLLKNRGATGPAKEEPTFASGDTIQFSVEDSSDQSGIVVKVIIILIFPVLLYAYEWYNISQLETQAAAVQSQLTNIQNQVNALKPEADKAKLITQEYDAFRKKIELIKEIGKKRLREIRALDHLQNIIPEKAWFTTIKFEENRFTIEGVVANDQTLDALLEGIRRHPGFKDVLLAKAVEQKGDQGTLKSFVINSNMTDGG